MTATSHITLPTPVEANDLAESRSEGLTADVHAVAEAKARARVLASLGMIRETHQGANVASQSNDATDTFDDVETAFEEQISAYADGVQDAQRDRVQEATIDILAGMVARLMAEKSYT
jgi:hypothetical protein